MKKLRELVVDETFEMFVLLKTADVRVARNGKKFIAFTFQDTSGTIDGKYWGATEEEIEKFTVGNVVFLGGKRETYQNMPQVKILHLRLAQEDEPRDPVLYMEKSPVDSDEMREEINQFLFAIDHGKWHRIVRHVLSKYQQEFFEFPAAKRNHHAFAGGLAYHTVTMLRLAKAVCEQYAEVNPALLYAGTILHDLGKVKELSGAVSTEYTLAGNLLGHIVMADEEITKACVELSINEQDEDVLILKHVVLAHHGLLEYGSPVRPKIMEAEILHQIDNLDASIQMMLGSLKQVSPGEYTERIFGLDHRNFYLPNFKDN
ncbi:3'-5' exoribonuclease YhaM family protein [Vagococcus vulneris]|uniref:3'-5' exonuclease n=1 Tax=Vagococcus vulneris TaxID=1977869 RepID=A0A429ZXI2_9ENTE|nr:HD domain-containing protein [Vagococcus vulneris]RST98583.1 3'-5' exonuclease [Vagococcus vulneris]